MLFFTLYSKSSSNWRLPWSLLLSSLHYMERWEEASRIWSRLHIDHIIFRTAIILFLTLNGWNKRNLLIGVFFLYKNSCIIIRNSLFFIRKYLVSLTQYTLLINSFVCLYWITKEHFFILYGMFEEFTDWPVWEGSPWFYIFELRTRKSVFPKYHAFMFSQLYNRGFRYFTWFFCEWSQAHYRTEATNCD